MMKMPKVMRPAAGQSTGDVTTIMMPKTPRTGFRSKGNRAKI